MLRKRSRALWDDARRPRENKVDQWMSLLRAILYELQPIRFSHYHLEPVAFFKTRCIPVVIGVAKFVVGTLLPQVWSTLRSLSPRHWMMVAAVFLYYLAVRWLHEMIHAGPIVLIVTAMVAIFTVGLGDNADDELSAYSVFNRGFQRLMGSVDVEQLVNQHVGGGMMMMQQDGAEHENHDNNHQRARNQQRNNVARAAQQNNDDEEIDEDDNIDQSQNQSRKSGKKSRRKNREEKLELRRQREAAMAMGFDGTGGHDEMMALQRLVEEQVAGENQ